MTNSPPPAEELRILDAELRQLDARRAVLLARRAWLVNTLYAAPPAPLAPPARRTEATAPSVQNVLLVLGGLLLTVAAIAFTLVSWGHMGIAGRALVLGAVTLAALGVPLPLLRHGLRSTAEAVAGLGLALTVLDAYALHEVTFTSVQGIGYAAAASAVLAGVWAAYGVGIGVLVSTEPAGRAEGEEPHRSPTGSVLLRLPLPLALLAAQLPLLLWAVARDAGPVTITAAVLATAAADTAVALLVSLKPVRIAAAAASVGMGAWGVLAAGWLSWSASDPSSAAPAAGLLAFAAVIALTAAWHAPEPKLALGTALTGGLLLVAAVGGVLRVSLPGAWTVPGCLLCGVALLAVVRMRLPDPVRRGLAAASGCVQALAVAWALPLVALVLVGPLGWVERIWSAAPEDARAAVTTNLPWPAHAATGPLVLAVVAGVLVVAGRGTAWWGQALMAALMLGVAAAFVVSAVLELPYAVGMVVQGFVVVAVLAFAGAAPRLEAPVKPDEGAAPVRSPLAATAVVLALVTSLSLACVALASRTATLVVLAVLVVVFAAAAAWRRESGVWLWCAPASLAYATALTCAIGAAADWQPQHTALLVLAVPVVAAVVAARLEGSSMTVPVEVAGAGAGLLAIGLASTDPPVLALVLGLGGVVASGTALRPDRRHVGYVAAALFLLAAWVRLASWGVGTPEAYTLPVTVPALLLGVVRRRRDPRVSSWTAYGPGLTVTLVPSLLAAWGDSDWPRPLLLGAAALAVTLLGARHHLQAPLVLGGTVLTLVALHELAPYIAQVVGALPRWVPPALAGLALLALGATYEQRLRDARRVREVLGRFR
ncbi:SCO7613 C-terminal domain-containing membrane protein [Streptomyces bluensis]|uniref:SCO7613 C-terminal domain-containing membrane protein n=1 Tax=Streptomyces bluensis TaxID=33897 RepID=UPI003323F84D